MITREQILAEAKSWEFTPFHWQQSVKRRGCDCRGFPYGIARELDLPEARVLAVGVSNYRRDFNGERMLDGLRQAMWRTLEPQPADLIAMLLSPTDTAPRHLGILMSPGRMMHTYGRGPRCVLEVPMAEDLWPVHSYWTWPSLGDLASDH